MKRAAAVDARQPLLADGGVAHLQFEIGDDRGQIGVAAALAVAVDAALDVRETLLDGGQRVGDAEIGIVMRMDAEHAVEALANVGADLASLAR